MERVAVVEEKVAVSGDGGGAPGTLGLIDGRDASRLELEILDLQPGWDIQRYKLG